MSEHIAVSGIIGTSPRQSSTHGGVPITSFRLAAHQSHFDRAKNTWVDDDSSWYSVTTFRQLATNAAASLHKGERIVVSGRLVIRDWTNGERSGVDVEIIADSVGHDLTWYTTSAVRGAAPARPSVDQAWPATSAPEPELDEPDQPPESLGSVDSVEAFSEGNDRTGDGFVPFDANAEGDAQHDAYARLDS